jgi:uncharacterized protein
VDANGSLRGLVGGKALKTAAAILFMTGKCLADDGITIGTGSPSGLYYAAGSAICHALEKQATGVACQVAASRGSATNVLTLDLKKLQFGIVQSDVQFQAIQGRDVFALVGATEELRSVLSLHAEAFTVVIRADSSITQFNQLRGRRFNLGPFGTGTLNTGEDLLDALGWSQADRAGISNFEPGKNKGALCGGETDAVAYLIGHPSGSVEEVIKACPVRFLSLDPAPIMGLVKNKPYYAAVTIVGNIYPSNQERVATLGVMATLVTLASVPDDLVYSLVRSVFENLEEVRKASPAFAALQPEEMIRRGLTAPLHPAALKYYREKGWLDPNDPGVVSRGAPGSGPTNNPTLRLNGVEKGSTQVAPATLDLPAPAAKEEFEQLPPQLPVPKRTQERWETTPPPF